MIVLASSRVSRIATPLVFRRSKWLRGAFFALSVYALTRLFVVVVVMIAGRQQIAIPANYLSFHLSGSTNAAPGYWTVVTNWDGQWYRAIATDGYPVDLPRDAAGHITQNVWAFYPVYPMLVGGLMWVTGLSFALVGPAISVVSGAVGMVVLFRLIEDALGTTAAKMATVLTCTFMSAPVLQAAYTESLALLLLCSSLLLLRRRRYAWAALVIVLLALTRNVVLAMAPVILLHSAARWNARADDEFTTRDRLSLVGLAAICVAATGLWPAIAAAATGQVSAYKQTMAAWGGGLRVVIAWPRWFFNAAGPTGLVVFFVMLSCLFALLARPAARRWGPELWGWSISYPCYLLLATDVGSSTPRHLLLALPLSLLAVDFLRSMGPRLVRTCLLGLMVGGGLALQWIWIANFLVVTDPGHQPFP
jgi:hypothetical protein